MSQAAQIVLSAPNPFTSKPSFTYFETKYENTESPLGVSYEIPFDNQNLEFGSTYECTIPKYGDILTSVFLRTTLPAIYPPQAGVYVYPKTSSSFSGSLYVQQNITFVTADGSNLNVTTATSHFFSVGALVTISGTKSSAFNLDGVYTIGSIPAANAFVCSTTNAGVAYTGKASSVGIQPAPVVGYYSTQNISLWADKVVNLPYTSVGQTLTDPVAHLIPGQSVQVYITPFSTPLFSTFTVATSSANTFTLVNLTLPDTFSDFILESAIDVVYDAAQNKFVFSSIVYPSITFASARDAAFWGFDYLQGPSFPFVNGVLTSQWTLAQGGWVQGFLPPSLSNYDDSVAHKLIKEARILLGRQVIKRYTGEYLELINDLTIPYENKAILKLMNGTLDFTQAVAPREYYVSLPLGCESIPVCALTRQQISIEIDFEEYKNLSNDLNPGTGDFFDPNSYLAYDVSKNLLGGAPFNVSTTLSYQQYIIILTFSGTIVVYDTTKPIDEAGSYSVFTAFYGITSIFVNFVALGDILYIQLLNGYIIRGLLSELVKGNSSSFISNNYLPVSPSDAGPPTGSMVCDFRYLYYAQSNASQSNVFFIRYDTKTPFQENTGYTSFDFTSNISHYVSSVYQILSTGQELIAIVNNTPNKFFLFKFNSNFTTDWLPTNFILTGVHYITQGILIKNIVYFVIDNYSIITWVNGVNGEIITPSLPWLSLGTGFLNLHSVGTTIYASSTNACVITIDTTKDLTTQSAYQYYPPNAPFSITNNTPFIFANGPRFVYMFTNDASKTTTPTNVVRYDPYPSTPVLQASIIADYKILPKGVPKPTDATIKYVQNQHVTGQNFSDLQLLGPIKEIILTGAADTANVYQYANLASNLSLTITGHEQILTPDVGTNTALQTIAPFQYHTSMPIRNLSVLPFEIDPESSEPNGTVNFSRLQYQLLSNGSSAWASSYNILKISSGIGGLEFNSPY